MAKGNKNATGKGIKHGSELVQRTRKGILNAFDWVEMTSGKTISEILGQAFIDNPLRFMDTAAKYMPKDINLINNDAKDIKQLTDAELQELIAQKARDRRELALQAEAEAKSLDLSLSLKDAVDRSK